MMKLYEQKIGVWLEKTKLPRIEFNKEFAFANHT